MHRFALRRRRALVATSGIGMNPVESAAPARLQSASGLARTLTWTITFARSEIALDWIRKQAGSTPS